MLLLLLNSLVLIAFSALLFAPRKGFLPLELKYVVFSPPISGFCPSKSSKTDEPPNEDEDELYDVVFTELRSFPFVSFSLSLSLSLLLLLFAPKTVVEDEVSRPIDHSRCGRRCRQSAITRTRRALLQRPIVRERRRPAARRDGPCRHVRIAVLLFACARVVAGNIMRWCQVKIELKKEKKERKSESLSIYISLYTLKSAL